MTVLTQEIIKNLREAYNENFIIRIRRNPSGEGYYAMLYLRSNLYTFIDNYI